MKKLGLGWLAIVGLLAAGTVPLRADGPTLLVAPARYSVLQVGFDLVQRYGVILVAYRGEATTEKALIHVWTGQEWKYVALPDFQSGAFLAQKPAQTLLIGDAQLVPAVFTPMEAWAGRLTRMDSLYTDAILNQASKALWFTKEDWAWFAARYNMKLDDTNAALRNDSWYRHAYDQPVHLQFKRRPPVAAITNVPAAEVIPPAVISTNLPAANKAPAAVAN